jgi:ATP-dependent RNA helicase DHX8/PRP22
MKDKEVEPAVSDDVFLKELGDLVSGKKRPSQVEERSPKRQRLDSPPHRRRSPSPPPSRRYDDRNGDRRGRTGGRALDDRPILFKIYNGRVSGLKDFGAFVTLEGVAGRVEGTTPISMRLDSI